MARAAFNNESLPWEKGIKKNIQTLIGNELTQVCYVTLSKYMYLI